MFFSTVKQHWAELLSLSLSPEKRFLSSIHRKDSCFDINAVKEPLEKASSCLSKLSYLSPTQILINLQYVKDQLHFSSAVENLGEIGIRTVCIMGGEEEGWGGWPPAPSGAPLYLQKDDHWTHFDNSVNAVSFGFVATAILISMFLVMAIFEKLLRTTTPALSPSAAPRRRSDIEAQNHIGGFNAKLGYPSPKVSISPVWSYICFFEYFVFLYLVLVFALLSFGNLDWISVFAGCDDCSSDKKPYYLSFPPLYLHYLVWLRRPSIFDVRFLI